MSKTKKKFPPSVQISPTLKAVPDGYPFNDKELWWKLYVMSPKGYWVSVQGGPKASWMWHDLGVTLPE